MKVPEAKSNFFKIGRHFASNAFVSFKNTPKSFQISFLGHRNAKFIIFKSKMKKKKLVKTQVERLHFTTILRQKFLQNFAKTASKRWLNLSGGLLGLVVSLSNAHTLPYQILQPYDS